MVPAGLALVLHGFEVEQRSHAVALISAIGALAAGLGPAIGGVLIAIADWRLVFLVNLPIGAAAYVLASRRLVESREAGRRRLPDMPGAAIFALSVAVLIVGIVNGGDWGWTSPGVIASFAASGLCLAAFVRRCRRHRAPVLEARLFANRTFSVANAVSVIGAAGFFGYTLVNVLFLTGVWDYSVLEAGLAITPGPVHRRSDRRAHEPARSAHRLPAGGHGRRPDLGRRAAVVGRSGRSRARLRRRVAARACPPGRRRRHHLPEHQRGGGGLSAG